MPGPPAPVKPASDNPPRPARPDEVVPAALAEQTGSTYPALVSLMQKLLGPGGCPWDRKQTISTVRRYVMEEACEVVDAIDRDDLVDLRAELGDLLLQVVFLGELAREKDAFGPDDVVAGIVNKLIRRHPHVWGDVDADDAEAALAAWERVKAQERAAKGGREGTLDSVPRSMPALSRAERLGKKAASVGFDWPEARGARAKLDEELEELDKALADAANGKGDPAVERELGDVLFSLVNVARHAGVDPEAALRGTLRKFETRFQHVETRVNEHHGGFASGAVPLDDLERYWGEAKTRE